MKSLTGKLIALAFIGSMTLASCGDGDGNADNTDTMTTGEEMQAAADTVQDAMNGDQDQRFVKDAVELNTKELAWIHAGIDHGTDADVKKHAKHMLPDHEKMGAEVSAYAAKKSMEVPTVDVTNEVDMNDKKGRDWDKKWADKMVDDHEKAINRFENASANVKDPELKTMIDNTLPTLRSHLEMAKTLQAKFNK
jgi:putative membrane protein